MKFIHNSFDSYLQEYDKANLHPKLLNVFKSFPDDITKMRNIILYGPENSGKYTQFLQSIRKYSNSKLKYEKKLQIESNKQDFFIKISDIHYEVDISLLGCNAKVLWNTIFNQIIDIILTKPKKNGIIVCKNFHTIHSELLDIFYSYMQKNICNHYHIVFFLLTEHVSFIPDNILNCCKTISVSKPVSNNYSVCYKNKSFKNIKSESKKNIKLLKQVSNELYLMNFTFCEKIIDSIINYEKINFLDFRDLLYDLFVYNTNIYDSLWFILSSLIEKGYVKDDMICNINIDMYKFLKLYNNNYRPIYHLELFLFNIIKHIHRL